MIFLNSNKSIIKYSLLTLFGSSAGWIYYQTKHTEHPSSVKAIDRSVMTDIHVPNSFDIEYIEIESISKHQTGSIIKWIQDTVKFMYVRRLLAITKDSDIYHRRKAINELVNIKLDDWHCALLANMIDSRLAVALARMKNVDERLFREPPFRYHNYNQEQLIDEMREFLIRLFELSKHSCISYFLSKIFVFEHDSGHIIDHDSSVLELSKFSHLEKDVLPMCLESILHHCSIESFSKDIAQLNGLTLLMEIYKRYSNDDKIIKQLCQILSYISVNKELLEPFYISGWIGVLLKWSKHKDIRISIPAAKALTNLDEDNTARYSRNLYLLHPLHRTNNKYQDIDVIFIHGLLGGIFYTWRQRNKTRKFHVPVNEEISRSNNDEDEYEMVWNDIPLNSNTTGVGPFTCPISQIPKNNNNNTYTYCWPKDWLAKDCKNIRILGINYRTTLSKWNPLCPLEKTKLNLNERSDLIAEQLLQCEVGRRPIVWVTHSMGGLIVKNILAKGLEYAVKAATVAVTKERL